MFFLKKISRAANSEDFLIFDCCYIYIAKSWKIMENHKRFPYFYDILFISENTMEVV